MESPGEYLKREREHRGITLNAVHEVTRIQKKHLEALEADAYDRLPHPTFVKGFIKAYCRMLGLDENDAALRYDIFLRESDREGGHSASRGPAPEGMGDNGTRASRNNVIIGACVAAGIVLILVFYAVSSREPAGPVARQAEEAASASQEAQAEAEGAPAETTAAAAPEGAAEDAIEKAAPPAPTTLVSTPRPAPVAPPKAAPARPRAAEPETKAAVEKPAEPEKKAVESAAATESQAAAPVAEQKDRAAASTDRHTLSLTAAETAWVQLSIDNGEPFDVMLRSGESLSWTAINEFSLVIGNAGGIAVDIDGRKLPPLGKKGEVVRLKLPEKTTER